MEQELLKSLKNKFLRHSLIISTILAAIFLMLKFGFKIDILPWTSFFIIIFFLILSNFLFHVQLKVVNERIIRFVNRFMLISGMKLFVFLFIILVYGFVDRDGFVAFALVFLITYFTFSIFEVIQIIKIQKILTS